MKRVLGFLLLLVSPSFALEETFDFNIQPLVTYITGESVAITTANTIVSLMIFSVITIIISTIIFRNK